MYNNANLLIKKLWKYWLNTISKLKAKIHIAYLFYFFLNILKDKMTSIKQKDQVLKLRNAFNIFNIKSKALTYFNLPSKFKDYKRDENLNRNFNEIYESMNLFIGFKQLNLKYLYW